MEHAGSDNEYREEQRRRRKLMCVVDIESTARGQIERLPFDLLMLVCSHATVDVILKIPCVSKRMEANAGTLMERMPLMSNLAFNGSDFGTRFHMHMKFMIHSSVPMGVIRTAEEFVEVAVRAALHKPAFLKLGNDLEKARFELQKRNMRLKDIVDSMSRTGCMCARTFPEGDRRDCVFPRVKRYASTIHLSRDDWMYGRCWASEEVPATDSKRHDYLVKAVDEVKEARRRVSTILKALDRVNKEFDLRAVVQTDNLWSKSVRKNK